MTKIYPNYIAFIEEFVRPLSIAHPNWERLDGRTANEPTPQKRAGIVAYVLHDGDKYQVDADCRIDNLLAAYDAWKVGKIGFPVEVGPSRSGKKKLKPANDVVSSRGFFLYNPEPFSSLRRTNSARDIQEGDADHEAGTSTVTVDKMQDDFGQIDPLERVSTTRSKRDAAFRRRVLQLWGERCVLTGCEDLAVLDAAHIDPHAETGDNRVSNGVPLRTDLNRLMETGGLTFKKTTDGLIAQIASDITFKEYRQLHGKQVRRPPHFD